MSLRERVLIVVGVLIAVGLVVYPLAYRVSSEQARAAASSTPQALATRMAAPSHASPTTSLATPIRTPTVAPTLIDPTPREIPEPSQPSWRADAVEHQGADGKKFSYNCVADGTFGAIWGTDTYTHDSSVCTAGVHAGVITRQKGGTVTIVMRAGLGSYEGSTRNGVTTESWGPWNGSFEVVSP